MIARPCRWAFTVLLFTASLASAQNMGFTENDWPWWRGPQRNGVAAKQTPPLKWSATENVAWKTPVPGKGHSSPTVVGEHIYLATADYEKQQQSVLCFERKSGKKLWQTEVHKAPFPAKQGNGKSTLASSTIACDGERLFINFLHEGAIHLSALTRDGKILWQKKVTDYKIHQGFGSSPAIYGPLVIVSADSTGDGLVAGFNRENGDVVWKHARPKTANYASPIILNVAGKDQLIFTGCELVSSYQPLDGKRIWEIKGSTVECVTSTVTDGERIITSGGYPKNHVAAIKADGSGEVAWENNTRVYVPSLIAKDGYLYGVGDSGITVCWKFDTGKEQWKGRIDGVFSASPVLVGDLLFCANETGMTYIWKATPSSFELIGQNQLGDEAMATPTFVGNRIYARVAHRENGKRQEYLYCLGK